MSCTRCLRRLSSAQPLLRAFAIKAALNPAHHPDSNEVARDVVSVGERTQHLARNEVLDDLPFELDAVGAVLAHGLIVYPLKAR